MDSENGFGGMNMWTRRDLVSLATATSAAFALTLAIFWSSPTHAVDAASEKTIAKPIYHDGACEITADITASEGILGTLAGSTFLKPGKVPAMQLTVHNSAQEPAATHFNVALNVQSMRDWASRNVTIRPPAWSHEYEISLAPGETKTLDINCGDIKIEKMDSLSLFVGMPAPMNAMKDPNVPAAPPDMVLLNKALNSRVNLVQITAADEMPAEKPVRSASAMPVTR